MTYSVNCSTLFLDKPLLARPAAAKAAGFDNVEFWWPFASPTPPPGEIGAFESAIQQADVQLTALNFYAGDMAAGERGVVSQAGRVEDFRDNVFVVAALGERLGCRYFNALYGNEIAGYSWRQHEDVAIKNLVFAAETMSAIGGTVLVEALSGAPDYPLTRAVHVFDVIAKTTAASGSKNIKLLADFYHLSQNGEDVQALITSHATEFGHIQIADAPGRGAPGSGELPLTHWIRSARDNGYEGIVGLEYFSGSENPFTWLSGAGN
jgi:hydroxypyruvate isomerase